MSRATIQRFNGFHHETKRYIKLSNDHQDIILHFTKILSYKLSIYLRKRTSFASDLKQRNFLYRMTWNPVKAARHSVLLL